MTTEQIKKVRDILKHLPEERIFTDEDGTVPEADGTNVNYSTCPLRVMCGDGNMWYDEAFSCFLWDDDNGILYVIMPNTKETNSLDSRLFPEEIYALDYNDITKITARVDRYSLDNFLEKAVNSKLSSKPLTNEATRKRYFDQMTSIYDPRSYLMGMPSTTTEKGGMRPGDDNILSVESVNTL